MDASITVEKGIGATKTLPDVSPDEGPRLNKEVLDKLLSYCIENGVEDLILMTDEPWSIKWSGGVYRMGYRKLYDEELQSLVNDMSDNRNASLDILKGVPVDFAYVMSSKQRGVGNTRFRCNATGVLGGMEIVIRPALMNVMTMDQLGIPQNLQAELTPGGTGLVTVCGQTGSGKSTLLDAAIGAHAVAPIGKHILTFNSPIEGDLRSIPNRTGIIAQSDVGSGAYGGHIADYVEAVRNCLRRHPDIVVFGEARDAATIAGVAMVAQTGHLTYTTTHTNNTHMAFNRMGEGFSGGERVSMIGNLIQTSRVIIHQRLVRTPTGVGRAPVRSWLVTDLDIRNYLSKLHVDEVATALRELTLKEGKGLLEDAIEQFELGKIHENELNTIRREVEVDAGG